MAKRKLSSSGADRTDRVRLELVGARAAVMTTVLLLDGRGVYTDVATNLRRAALIPIDAALAALEVPRG